MKADNQRALKREMEKDSEPQHKEFSEAEIKQRLKNNSKGDLIKIIINLSKRIDENIEHNEDVRNIVNDVNSGGGFSHYSFYSNIIDAVDAKGNSLSNGSENE